MAGIEYDRPDREARSLPVCPGCGACDEVRAVQAVFLEGHREVREETGAGSDRRTVNREVVSRLARALAPTPPTPSVQGRGCLGAVLVLVSIGTFLAGSLAGHWFTTEPGPEYPYPGWDEAPGTESDLLLLGVISAVALLGAVCLFAAIALANRAYSAKVRPGLPAAERLWLQGWYCARCARVHFDGEGAALTLHEFRLRVWTAGGYGDLAERYRGIDQIVGIRPDGSSGRLAPY
ncbi:hypothetical protein OG730_36250 [Streptomyces sp. NBC_01298]|uniref:hypothetical protein n=1 Tax=Streptomyces sp. NBC_01298 TaxID=2903817 RepID=UPI002E126162|nr:hypothetical protein OG730_36250 [Streptomyces sp. NBC_01298]